MTIPHHLTKQSKNQGEWIAICDDDDYFTDKRMDLFLAAINQTNSEIINAEDQLLGLLNLKFQPELIRKTNFIPPSSSMIKKSLIEKLGGFDESLTNYWDWDFWLRAFKETTPHHLNQVVTRYMLHNQNQSKNSSKRAEKLTQLIEKHQLAQLTQKFF